MPNLTYYPRSAANCERRRLASANSIQQFNIKLIYIIYILTLVTLLVVPSILVQTLQLPRQQPQQAQQSAQDDPEARCLSCIRSVTSIGVEPNKRCEGGYFCGPFQISYQYWAEAGKPGYSQNKWDFEKCARDKQCAEQTVKAYFKKFKRDCNNDGTIDCLDMAALHKAGPAGCSSDWFFKSRYWSTFNKTACATRRDPVRPTPVDRSDLFGLQQPDRQVVMKNQTLTTDCLDCICEALSSCGATSPNNCGSGLVCGPFAISMAYWKDGRKPGSSWTACARTKECSSITIRNYMDKYKRDCNGDGYLTCEDYAAIHRRGPMSCTNRDLLKEQYWTRFLTCRANQKISNDANLVKVSEDTSEQASGLASRVDPTSSAPIVESAIGLTTLPVRSHSISNLLLSQSSTLSTPTTLSSTTTTTSSTTTNTTTTTTTTSTTTTTPAPQPTTRYRPFQYETNGLGPSNRPTLIVADQNPTVYDLNPVLLETQATSNRVSNYQTMKPSSHQQAYDRNEHQYEQDQSHQVANSATRVQVQDSSELAQTKSSTLPAQTLSTGYSRPQVTQTVQTYQETAANRRLPPPSDYNSMPTIIVSKRIETHSTSRVDAQAPQASSIDEIESGPPTSVTSSMASLPPATQGATFPSHELPTTVGASNLESAASQQQAAQFSPTLAPNDQLGDQNMDDALSDFAGNGANVDRASFDRVVNGIVANPDFSKSYPPVPEIIVQRKQPASPSTPRGPPRDLTQTTKVVAADSLSAAAQAASKRENSKTLSPNIYNTLESEQSPRQDGDQPNFGSLLGPNAVNMTSLFEKGLNESSKIASECLDCICDASSNCDATVQCISKQREKNRCGLYMISWNQYKESDISLTTLLSSPTSSSSTTQSDDSDEKLYYECTTDKNCAEKLIHLYIEKYQKDCNADGKIDCYDIAAIHRVGPESCNSNKFLASQYWRDFNHCYTTDRLTTTMQPQPAASQGG